MLGNNSSFIFQQSTYITEITELNRLLEYLFKSTSSQVVHISESLEEDEPFILKSEVEILLSNLRANKASGYDNTCAEVIKAMVDYGIDLFHKLCQFVKKLPQKQTFYVSARRTTKHIFNLCLIMGISRKFSINM